MKIGTKELPHHTRGESGDRFVQVSIGSVGSCRHPAWPEVDSGAAGSGPDSDLKIKIQKVKSLPVLVESTAALLAQVLSPDGLEGAQTFGSLDVANHADDDNWRRLQNGNGLDHLLFVHLGAGLVDLADDVRHAGLVGHKGRQVDGFGLVILGESLNLAAMTLAALLGGKGHGAMARRRKFTMRLVEVREVVSIIEFN